MRDDLYKIVGDVVIPEEKKEEFNRHILQLLYRGGIRRLDADLAGRKALAEDALYGTVAEVSLYVLPAVFVQAYGTAVDRDFWDVWKDLGIKGYSEIITKQRDESDIVDGEKRMTIPLYKAILRKNEDEIFYFQKF